jgi:hypothetical protein
MNMDKKVKPIYKDLLSKVEGVSDKNPMAHNITIEIMHSVLHREHTLASGGSLCDYWTVGDRIKNPK